MHASLVKMILFLCIHPTAYKRVHLAYIQASASQLNQYKKVETHTLHAYKQTNHDFKFQINPTGNRNRNIIWIEIERHHLVVLKILLQLLVTLLFSWSVKLGCLH